MTEKNLKINNSRFIKWLRDNGHIPKHYGTREFEDKDIHKFWKEKSKAAKNYGQDELQ